MITPIEPGQILYVTGNSTSQIEDELSDAVVLVRQQAHDSHQGILITRLGPGSYTVALDAGVPFGVTDERDAWTSQGLSCDSGPAAKGLLH